MKVDTESSVTKKAQDGVLEFLLINHPLDCPVCDRGGECPLQDQTLAFGPGESRFVEEKRHFDKPIPISDLVDLDRERCILCDRCTRFSDEVAGDPLISLHRPGRRRPRSTPSRTTRSPRTSAATPCRSARSARSRPALPLQGPPVGPRPGGVDVHLVLGRLPHGRAVVGRRSGAQPRRRRQPRQLGLAVRQGPLRLRGPQQRRPRSPPRCARRGDACRGDGWAEAVGTAAEGLAAAWPPAAWPCSAAPACPTRTPTPGRSWPARC